MRPIVIKAPAGIGKTAELAQHVATGVRGITEVYVGTHKNAKEWHNFIKTFNPEKRVAIIAGRSAKDNDGKPLCVKHKIAEDVARAGFSVYPHLCCRRRGESKPPLLCEHYRQCKYIQQFHHAEVYIYMHAHLVQPRTVLEEWTPSLVIIDESFINTCVKRIEFSLSLLRHADLPEAAKALCHDIAAALTENRPVQARIRTALDTGEMQTALDALLQASMAITPSMTEREQKAALKHAVGFAQIRTFLQHLKGY